MEGKWDGTGIVFPDGILTVDGGIGGNGTARDAYTVILRRVEGSTKFAPT